MFLLLKVFALSLWIETKDIDEEQCNADSRLNGNKIL